MSLELLATLRSHKRFLFILPVPFILFYLLWSPRRPTVTLAIDSDIHTTIDSHIARPYTAAIIYLAGISRVSELLESFAAVHRNLTGHPWPIILFHPGDFEHDSMRMDFVGRVIDYIGTENGSVTFAERIEFVKLDWQLPKGISPDVHVVNPVDAHRWPG
jgi:mannosyltransferase